MVTFIRADLANTRQSALSLPQFRVLVHLTEQTRNNRELADLQGVTVATMSRLVDGLVQRSLVTRQKHATDRRQIRLKLSSQGKTLVRSAFQALNTSLTAKISSLTSEERQALDASIDIMMELFE